MYTDPSGELGFLVAVGIGMLVAATTYTMTALLADVPFSVGGLLKATFIGAASAAVTFGIGSAASSMFSTPAMGFWQGAYQGAVIGAITGAGGVAANAIFTGQSITLKAVLGGAAVGGLVGGVVGGIQAQNRMGDFYNACDKMGITPDDPVPATDDFISEAQRNFFPDAPMDKVKNFSVENLSDGAKKVFAMKPDTYGVTFARSANGVLTGNSSVYFNPNTAFTSAKTLYFAMGHEFVHVSQYASLIGNNVSILNQPGFQDMLEFHAYSYQHNVLGDQFRGTMFTPDVVREFSKNPFFGMTNYINYSWANNTSFMYPFIKK